MIPQLSKRTGVIGAVAAVAFIVGALLAVRALDRSQGPTEAARSEPSVLHEGEVLELADDGTTLVARDTATRGHRPLARCTECAGIRQFAPSAGGRWIAYDATVCLFRCGEVEPDAGIWVVGPTGPPLHVTTDYFPLKFHWSPTAQLLGFVVGGGDGSDLILFDPATGERTSIVTTEGAIPSFAWSPDGSMIAYATDKPSEPSGIFVVRPGADPERIGGPSIEHPCCVSVTIDATDDLVWSPDGTRLAVRTPRDGLTIVRVDGSGEQVVLDREPGDIAWSPDGRRIAYVERHDVRVVPAGGGTPVLLAHMSGQHPGNVAWSPDGTLVAFDLNGGRDWNWNAGPADGSGTLETIDRLEVERWIQG